MAPSLLSLVRASEHDDRVDVRAKVLDAALRAFLDFGIRRSSMTEVAKRAGISPATLYRRFAQKSELVQAVGLREVRRFLADVDTRLDSGASADDQLVELFVAFAEGLRRNRLLRRLLDTEPDVVLPYLTTQGAPVLALGTEYLAELLARLQDAGELPRYDPTPVAEVMARLALTFPLLPQTSIPLADRTAAREFARAHLLPLCRPVPVTQAARTAPTR